MEEITKVGHRQAELGKVRDEAIRQANASGIGYRKLAAETGLSVQRIAQIVHASQEDK